jgi:peptidoglycan/xylan/chitin deacetylase (PgdA/CDA1 family)
VSEWADDAACPHGATAAASVCHDALPDRGAVAVRVHRGYVVGCIPAGASLRSSAARTSRRVALTFDDGPGPQTAAVLRILQRAHVRATFFELGVQVRLYPALVRRTLAEGHVIGNHTWDHKTMTRLSSADADSELARASGAIERASRYTPCLFRPPSGAINGAVASLARQRKMLSIVWDVDPRDWALPGTGAIVSNVLANARAGSIILLHDAGGPRGETLAALPQIIAGLRARHLTFVTVPELLGLAPSIAWD